MRRVLIHTFVIISILVIGALPLISTMIAGAIADANGCVLHEGFANPCVINGTDQGETLYTMGMLGWLAIGTLPVALTAAGIYLVIVIVVTLILTLRKRSQQATT